MTLVELVYRRTTTFPKMEIYGLAAQMRRSAISVPSNIAEGAGRNTAKEYLQYLGIASGSLAELDTQLELAGRLGLGLPDAECISQVSRVGKFLVGLRNSLRERIS